MNYNTLRIFFDGMLFMMLLFTLITFLWQRKKVHAYYGLYILSALAYFYINDLFYFHMHSDTPDRILNMYDFSLGTIECISFNLYARFAIQFMDLPKNDRLTVKVLNIIAIVSLLSILVDGAFFLLNAVNENFYDLYRTVNRYALTILALAAIFRIMRLRNLVVNFFILGSFFYVAGMLTAVVMLQTGISNRQEGLLYTFPMIPTQLGVILEAICFTIGFSVLNRRTELDRLHYQEELVEQLLENEKKQQKLQLIRDEIARDLHDEIGSDLSALSIMGDMGIKQADTSPEEAKTTFRTIAKVSRSVLSTMREIVWSLNSTQDSVESMGLRMKETAQDMFQYTNTKVHVFIPRFKQILTIQPHHRRDLLLILKEVLHNIIKHANAPNVFITLTFDEQDITLKIEDDGVGFDYADQTFSGNGLRNLRQRADKLTGKLYVKSKPGKGTVIMVNCPIHELKIKDTGEVIESLSVNEI